LPLNEQVSLTAKPAYQDIAINPSSSTGIDNTKSSKPIISDLNLQKANSTSAHLSPPNSSPLNALDSIYGNVNHPSQTKSSIQTTSMPLTSVKQNPLLKALSEDKGGNSGFQVVSNQSSVGPKPVALNGGPAVTNDRNSFPNLNGTILPSNGSLVPNPQPSSSFVRAGVDPMPTSASQVCFRTLSR
jgi:hypothetical protein